jgi:uncharacterized iron-regulated membrane protein
MKAFRTTLFWLHLAAGVAAGLVIFVMSATGAVLAFKPQILNQVDRRVRFVEPAGTPRLAPSQILAAAQAVRPDGLAATLVLDRDPAASAAVGFGRDGTLYVNPYTGAVLGGGSAGAQQLFRTTEDLHRWLSLGGENRDTGRSLTGASNMAFLALAVSGLFLWWPHKWLPQHVNAILFFRRTATARARDFNWHNVIGFWCAPVLIVLTATGAVMSYPWANRALYQMAGSPLPAARGPQGQRGPQGSQDPWGPRVDADRLWARAEQLLPTWQTVTMRLPERPRAPVSFTMNDARHWNAFARSQLALDAATGDIVRWEPYAEQSRGQKWRGWVRFGHTGELGGIAGQTLAGIACLCGAVLVWTGLALAFRRLLGWRLWRRLAVPAPVASPPPVAAPMPE